MGAIVLHRLHALGLTVQRLGPYLLIELLLPGGTLIALMLYLVQRGREAVARGASPLAVAGDELLELSRSIVDRLPFRGVAGPAAARRERDGLEPLAMAPG